MGGELTRPFTVHRCDQKSAEWLALRCGQLTGSRAADAFTKTKTNPKWTADRKNLKMLMTLERVTGQPQERKAGGYQIRDGEAREPHARRFYEVSTGMVVRECGFISDNEIPIGCSPDGYIGDFEGLVSIKCPLAATHLETLTKMHEFNAAQETPAERVISKTLKAHTLVIPEEYRWQIQHELYVTGAAWCDYLSYDASFPEALRSVVVRVLRSDFDWSEYSTLVQDFLAEVDAEVEKVLGLAA